eukprot:Gb_02432 [translate_table: standard]
MAVLCCQALPSSIEAWPEEGQATSWPSWLAPSWESLPNRQDGKRVSFPPCPEIWPHNLGVKTTIVVSSPAMAKEVLKTNDQFLAGRTVIEAAKCASYSESSLVWNPCGPRWRMLRRICNTELFSAKRLEALQHLRRDQVFRMVGLMYEDHLNGKSVNIGHTVLLTTVNLLGNMIFSQNMFGRDSDAGEEFKEAVAQLMELGGVANLADFFPWLRFLDPQGVSRDTTKYLKFIFGLFAKLIKERLASRQNHTYASGGGGAQKDLLDVLFECRSDGGGDDVKFTEKEMTRFLYVRALSSVQYNNVLLGRDSGYDCVKVSDRRICYLFIESPSSYVVTQISPMLFQEPYSSDEARTEDNPNSEDLMILDKSTEQLTIHTLVGVSGELLNSNCRLQGQLQRCYSFHWLQEMVPRMHPSVAWGRYGRQLKSCKRAAGEGPPEEAGPCHGMACQATGRDRFFCLIRTEAVQSVAPCTQSPTPKISLEGIWTAPSRSSDPFQLPTHSQPPQRLSVYRTLRSHKSFLLCAESAEAPLGATETLPSPLRADMVAALSIAHSIVVLVVSLPATNMSCTNHYKRSNLSRRQHALKRLQAELEEVVGRERKVEESDTERLPYLHAVVKEVFRLHPAAPLLIQHRAESSCKIAGFDIPKGAEVVVNVWAIGRDPTIWKEPSRFFPERFWESEIGYKGQHFELLPFGSGRRICPGLPLANRMVHFVLASLLHSFDWTLPDDQRPEKMDMTPKFGITLRKDFPLKAIPSPRLPATLY